MACPGPTSISTSSPGGMTVTSAGTVTDGFPAGLWYPSPSCPRLLSPQAQTCLEEVRANDTPRAATSVVTSGGRPLIRTGEFAWLQFTGAAGIASSPQQFGPQP